MPLYPKLPPTSSSGASNSSNSTTPRQQSSSWSGIRPVADNTPAVPMVMPRVSRLPVSPGVPTNIRFLSSTSGQSSTSESGKTTSSKDSTGLKIRIPRDLPNLPDAFRTKGNLRPVPPPSRSSRKPATSPTIGRSRSIASEPLFQTKLMFQSRGGSVDNSKRTHTDMITEDSKGLKSYMMLEPKGSLNKKFKPVKSESMTPGVAKVNPSGSVSRPFTTQASKPLPVPSSIPRATPIIPQNPPVETPISSSSVNTTSIGLNLKHTAEKSTPTGPPAKRPRGTNGSRAGSPIPVSVRAILPKPNSPASRVAVDDENAMKVSRPAPMDVERPSEPIVAIDSTSTLGAGPGTVEPTKTSSETTALDTLNPEPLSVNTVTASNYLHDPNIPSNAMIEDAAKQASTHSDPGVASVSTPDPMITVSESGKGIRSTDLGTTDIAAKGLSPRREESTSTSIVPETIPSSTEPILTSLEFLRLGTTVLNRILSNPVCHYFINKVPLVMTKYHAVIKKPVDLSLIECKLWRTVLKVPAVSEGEMPSTLRAARSYVGDDVLEEGYSGYKDFEDDLKQIYQNAVVFNPPHSTVYKEAQAFQELFVTVLQAIRDNIIIPPPQVPQEMYTPSLASLSKPGPLYLFRTHNVREMDRKMTDLSIELYATFHLPLLQIALSSTPLSPEMPKFTRLYITKNRSLLHHCRDEPYAKIAILVDYHAGKPFIADAQTTPIGVIKPGSRVVQIKARVIIAKPIGDRHEMVTVGDLDCPSAWIMIACVKIVDIDVNVPAKFERGTLSKLRHEIFALSGSARLTPEEESAFSAALGIAPPNVVEHKLEESIADTESLSQSTAVSSPTVLAPASSSSSSSYDQQSAQAAKAPTKTIDTILPEISLSSFRHAPLALDKESAAKTDPTHQESSEKSPPPPIPTSPSMPLSHVNVPLSSVQAPTQTMSLPSKDKLAPKRLELNPETNLHESELSSEQISLRALSTREMQLLRDLKVVSQEKDVPYVSWNSIEPSLTVDSAHGLFKRIYHVQGDDSLVVQNFKEMDAESFEQRVREVACLLKLRGLEGVGQIQSIIDDEREQLVGLSMTKYAYTLKTYATSARNPPSAEQKLCVIRDMVAALASIHSAGLAHRDLSEVNIMIDEDPVAKLADETPRPLVRVIDFGKSVFVEREEVIKWSMKEAVPEEELDLLPLVVVPPDHGYKLYRSILTLPRSKFDHGPLPPVDPQLEDVYSMGVLIWRVFSGQSPWSGVIEDDLTKIRYFVGTDKQIRFQLQREVIGEMSRELLLKCLTADPATRWSAQQLNEWLQRPEVLKKLLEEFKASGGGRKKRSTRKD